ncbi:MAG: arginase family protein [Microbacterium sp.]|uniref:arginase family protein n=1 Tax=Microbacterium sp. TaxID=51671 RepID=UPI003A845773
MARFVIAPQWQGSPSARAMMLVDGAQAIAGDLPRAACTSLEVPLEAGEAIETGVHRYSALLRVREALDEILADRGEHTVVIGGDCGISPAVIAAAAAAMPHLAVVWLDAHADLNVPATSPSGAFSGMALSAVLGDGPETLAVHPGIPPLRVVLAGVRAYDAGEAERAERLGGVLSADELAEPDALATAVQATGADAVYVHLDLDVLDPAALGGVTSPVPFGIDVAPLVAALRRLRAAVPLVGATIAGFAPPSPAAAGDDLGAILRVVGALA